jgi:hypothetical protein
MLFKVLEQKDIAQWNNAEIVKSGPIRRNLLNGPITSVFFSRPEGSVLGIPPDEAI